MEKFLFICDGLKKTGRFRYKTVDGYLRFLRFETNENKYFDIGFLNFPIQQQPVSIISFD